MEFFNRLQHVVHVQPSIQNKSGVSTYLFVNARDEPTMKQWIVHHLLLGFSKIIVFDHKSKQPLSLLGTFGGRVVIIPVNLPDGNIKIKLMNDALSMTKKYQIDWMIYLDADEYVYLKNDITVEHMLRRFRHADSVSINWLMFGSSRHVRQPAGLLIDNFTMSDLKLDKHVKTFVRPRSVKRCTNPHYYDLINPAKAYHISGYRMPPSSPFFHANNSYTNAFAYIAHYITQSEEEFHRRKGRPMDDGSVNKNAMYPQVHANHNEVQNTQMRDKYGNNVRTAMARYA